jgi:hypothetical protein
MWVILSSGHRYKLQDLIQILKSCLAKRSRLKSLVRKIKLSLLLIRLRWSISAVTCNQPAQLLSCPFNKHSINGDSCYPNSIGFTSCLSCKIRWKSLWYFSFASLNFFTDSILKIVIDSPNMAIAMRTEGCTILSLWCKQGPLIWELLTIKLGDGV